MGRVIFIITFLCFLILVSWRNGTVLRRSMSTIQPQQEKQLMAPNNSASVTKTLYPLDISSTCHSQGLPAYPPNGSIECRLPYALIIGSMKSGTTALSMYLTEHPHVLPSKHKELHFFDFKYKPQKDGIRRKDTRDFLKKVFQRSLLDESKHFLYSNPNTVAIEDSPRYMFLSMDIPARVLCVTPWVKILAILRNPVDRAYSQYNMHQNFKPNSTETFEDWVARDMELLQKTGVIQNEIPNAEFAGSEHERLAWKRYTRGNEKWVVGRGLYALQLRHWFQAYKAAGKDESNFMIIQSEQMRSNKAAVYKNVLEFLELEKFDLTIEEEPYAFTYNAPMKNETRELLQNFYKPYNKELYELLGSEWEGIWDS